MASDQLVRRFRRMPRHGDGQGSATTWPIWNGRESADRSTAVRDEAVGWVAGRWCVHHDDPRRGRCRNPKATCALTPVVIFLSPIEEVQVRGSDVVRTSSRVPPIPGPFVRVLDRLESVELAARQCEATGSVDVWPHRTKAQVRGQGRSPNSSASLAMTRLVVWRSVRVSEFCTRTGTGIRITGDPLR